VLGAVQIRLHPQILAAFNPVYALSFLRQLSFYPTLLILGPWFWS